LLLALLAQHRSSSRSSSCSGQDGGNGVTATRLVPERLVCKRGWLMAVKISWYVGQSKQHS